MVYYMRVVTVRLDDTQYEELKKLVKSGAFSSISDVIRIAVSEFISKKKLRWQTREELRNYLARKNKRFIESGRIIDEVRREEDWS